LVFSENENPMSTKGTISREVSRAVQVHIIRPLTDKAIEATVRHGPTVIKGLIGAVGGVLFGKMRRVPPRQTSVKQASFRIIEESEGIGKKDTPKRIVRKSRKPTKK